MKRSSLATPLIAPIKPPKVSISQVIRAATERHLVNPKRDPKEYLYDLVLEQVEPALLEAVLEHTEYNQSEAANVLGLNRGTLRKKLAKYGLL